MIRHVILFSLKPDVGDADREWLLEQIRGLAKIPVVKNFTLGKLLEPREDWYKPRIVTDYGWSFSMDFDDESALYAYQADAYHVGVAQEIRKRITVIKVLDFAARE